MKQKFKSKVKQKNPIFIPNQNMTALVTELEYDKQTSLNKLRQKQIAYKKK